MPADVRRAKAQRSVRPARPLWRVLALSSLLLGFSAQAATLRVAVAANFAGTLKALAPLFEQASGHRLQAVSGSTGKHYAQIRNGAPFDVFLAADARRPALLEAAGVGVPGTRAAYALGRLVLWSPSPGRVDSGGQVLVRGAFRRLALANPRLAPYGRAAQEVLQALGRWEVLQPRLVRGENVAQAFQFVSTGNAELGFVAWSQLRRADRSPQGSWWLVPPGLYRPIEQQALQLRDADSAGAFMRFLRAPAARAVIAEHGYALPDRKE